MKKSLFIIALACLMTFTACKKDKENQGEAQFTATTEHQGGRTSLNPNNGNITWTSGDQIVIANDNDETAVFSLQSGEGTTEGGFGTSGEFNTVGPFIAAYPSDAVIGNEKVTFNLPATQSIENTETFANGANPMVACSDDKNLSFKNLCGGLGIRLKGVGAHVSAVRITSKNTTEKLWGTFEVTNCAANEPKLTEASGNQSSNVITLTCDVTLTTAAKTFFVMLPPGTLANGFTMEVMDGDEVLATKETTSDIAMVERNNVKCFNEILIDVEFDGNVEIPTGMSNSNIIVTNLSEDAIPDENGDFAIGYSKSLIATNATNGEIVYMSILSVDNDINKGERQQQSYELSAKETALYYALTMIPFGLNQTKDETFQSIKDVLYDLACVQALENAIEQSVNQNGYLMPEDIGDELNAVWNYLEAELLAPFLDRQMMTNNDGLIVLKQDGTVRLEQPHLANNGRARGIRIDINSAHFNESSNTWTLNMTGYSDNGVFIGIQKGGFAQNGSPYPSSGRTPYFLPPMNMGKFMGTFTSFSGLKAYFSDTWRLFFEEGFGFDDMTWDQAKLEGITFELNQNENALFMRSPKDDQATAVINGVYAIMQVVGIALDDYLTYRGYSEFFTSLFSNQELCATIGGLVGHPENFQTAANALLDWAADLFATGAFQQYINPRYNVNKLLDKVSSGTARAAVTYVGNSLGTLASWYLFDSFVFRVYAEYNSGGGGGNAPTGAINGKFTINANGDQVYFSKGNLQYQASTNTWRFATNQWDYVGGTFTMNGNVETYGNLSGNSNNNISSSYNGWIDLFGWGTSGYNHGANAFQPWSISDNSPDYWAYGQSNSNLYDGNGHADWGYNAMANGGNAEGMWRTLTIDEWSYLFYNRPTLSGARFALASVNNVGGLILLPDDWNISVDELNNINVGDLINHPNDNVITASEWTNIFEANGAVFLPGAGTRYWQYYPGVINYENSESADGFYWSSSSNDDQNASTIYFYSLHSLFLDTSNFPRRTGLSVRLVRNAE